METNNELVQVITESGVEESTALTLQNSFLPFFEKAKEWKEKAESLVVTDVSQTREMKMAREARLALADIRIDADKKRKALKEDSLRYGKAVQGVYNVIEFLIKPIESHLLDQEKFAERQEEKRKAALKAERDAELLPYIEFVPYQVDLGELSDEGWQKLLSGVKLQAQAKIDAEKKAEEERIAKEKADDEERERMRVENEKLKAEAIEREKKAQEELAEQKRLADIEKKKQDDLLASEKAKQDAERKLAEEKLAKERAERTKIEAELKAKQDAEIAEQNRKEQAEKERIAAEKKAAKAPDKDKLTAWVKGINESVLIPLMSTHESGAVANDIYAKFQSFIKWANSQIETL